MPYPNYNINNCQLLPLTLSIPSEDECLYKALQAAITDRGLFTDTGVNERCENDSDRDENHYTQPKVSTSWSAPDGSLPRFHLINRISICGQNLFMFV